MKTTGLILCGLCLSLSKLSAQVTQHAIPPLAGWNYYGGDEFNGNKIDETRYRDAEVGGHESLGG